MNMSCFHIICSSTVRIEHLWWLSPYQCTYYPLSDPHFVTWFFFVVLDKNKERTYSKNIYPVTNTTLLKAPGKMQNILCATVQNYLWTNFTIINLCNWIFCLTCHKLVLKWQKSNLITEMIKAGKQTVEMSTKRKERGSEWEMGKMW